MYRVYAKTPVPLYQRPGARQGGEKGKVCSAEGKCTDMGGR